LLNQRVHRASPNRRLCRGDDIHRGGHGLAGIRRQIKTRNKAKKQYGDRNNKLFRFHNKKYFCRVFACEYRALKVRLFAQLRPYDFRL